MPANPDKNAWRGGGTPAGPARPAGQGPTSTRRSWQPGSPPPAAKPGRPAAVPWKPIAAGAAVLGLVAAIVTVILLWDPEPKPDLVFVAADPDADLTLPDNTAGHQAGRVAAGEWAEATDGDWEDAIGEWDKKEPLVLFFAGLGMTDAEGPHVWAPPKGGKGGPRRVAVKTIISRLGRLPAGRPKLLVFDAARTPAWWGKGMLHNGFARGLKALEPDIRRVENLAVICSADAGQRSWVCEEWGEPVFTHYFREGLHGAAAEDHERVTGKSLFDYVAGRVPRWARANRNEEQTPLLLPTADGAERAEAIVLTTVEKDPGAPAPAGGEFAEAEAERAWRRRDKLAASSPPPETAAPHLWREYLDSLLRYEWQVRLGRPGDGLKARLDGLHAKLSGRLLDADAKCLAAALPVADALGAAGHTPDRGKIRDLWRANNPKERDDIWRGLSGRAEGPASKARLRAAVCEYALGRLTDDAVTPLRDQLARAEGLFSLVSAGVSGPPGPVEAQMARVIGFRNEQYGEFARLSADGAKLPALIRKALKVRILAERVAWLDGSAHAGEADAWVRDSAAGADRLRRDAEDLIFADGEVDWDEAGRALDRAEAEYVRLQGRVRAVSQCLAVRDRAFAELPYYARWAAVALRGAKLGEVKKLLTAVEEAGQAAHALAEAADAGTPDADVGALKEKSEQCEAALKGLARRHLESVAAEGLGRATQGRWHALNAALKVPFIPAEDRLKFLTDLRQVSAKLLAKSDEPAKGRDVTPKADAERQGRMALAALGKPRVDEDWDDLPGVARGVEVMFGDLPKRAKKPIESAAGLLRACRAARTADPQAPLPEGVDPIAAARRAAAAALLNRHSDRALLEGWASVPKPARDEDHHCLRSATVYREAAGSLKKDVPAALWVKPKRAIEMPKFDLQYEADITLTFDKEEPGGGSGGRRVSYKVFPEKGPLTATPGVALLRLDGLPPGVEFARRREGQRLRLDFRTVPPSGPAEKSIDLKFRDETTGEVEGAVVSRVFHRGFIHDASSRTRLGKEPDLDIEYRPPAASAKARFAIVSEVKRPSSVDLVIDRTNSMWEPKTPPSKRDLMLKALENFLEDLPPGTQLRVQLFHGNLRGTPILTPVIKWHAWRQAKPFSGTARARVESLFSKLEVDHSTPIARTAVRAIRDQVRGDFKGRRNVVVLTDGLDSEIGLARGEQGAIVYRALLDSPKDIALHMVFFSLNRASLRIAVEQFDLIEAEGGRLRLSDSWRDKFRKKRKTPPQFYTARTADNLAVTLKEAARPRVIVTDPATGERPPGLGLGLPVTVPMEQGGVVWTPFLPAGRYTIDTGQETSLTLRPADRVILNWERAGGRNRVVLRHYADTRAVRGLNRIPRESADQGVFHMTAPKVKLAEKNWPYKVEMAVTLEKDTSPPRGDNAPGPGELQRLRPPFAWFEVAAVDAAREAKLRLKVTSFGRPEVAPVWDLTAWPWVPARGKSDIYNDPARAALTAYWIDAFPPDPENFTIDPADPQSARGRYTAFGVQVEVVKVALDGRFLTLEMKHEKGKRVLAQAGDLRAAGRRGYRVAQRHRYYDELDTYKVTFGPFTGDRLGRKVNIDLYSVERLKKDAAGAAVPRRIRADGERLPRPSRENKDSLPVLFPEARKRKS